MSFDLNGLSPYTDQLSQDLITRAVLKPQSVSNLSQRIGLTAGTTNINILGSNNYIIDYACGFGDAQTGPGGATGNATVFTTQPLVVATKMLKETLCPNELRQYWLSSAMSASGYQETVPFEQAIADLKVKYINKYIEQTIWQGDGNDLDGLQFQTSVGEGAIDGIAFAAGFASASTAYAAFWNMVDELASNNPEVLQEDDLIAYVSYATYSKLVQALQNKGNAILLQYPNISNVSGSPVNSFIWPGTNITVFAAPGIIDTGSPLAPTVILGPKKYAFFGTGLMDDQDKFKFYYDPSQDNVKFLAAFRMGTAAIADQFISTVA
jgi:hypothetical protein